MTISIETLTPIIDGAPGTTAYGRVGVFNDSPTAATVTIRVIGLTTGVDPVGPPNASGAAVFAVEVAANDVVECSVPVPVPDQIAPGQHAAAFEATSSRPGERPALAQFLLAVESIAQVDMIVEPVPIRGRRRAKFALTVGNGEQTPVSLTVDAEATDVRVRFKTSAFRLMPGQRTSTQARVLGPRLLVGEPIQHNLVIATRGKASVTTITAPYIQRPLFAHRARALVAGLAVIALFVGAIGGIIWVTNLSNATQEAEGKVANAALVQLEDSNGNTLDNGPYVVQADGSITDADGNKVAGFAVDANGNLIDANGNEVATVKVDPDTMQLVDSEGTPLGLPPRDSNGNLLDADGNRVDADGNPVDDDGNPVDDDGNPLDDTPSQTGSDGAPGAGGDGNGTSGGNEDAPVTGVIPKTDTIFRGSISAQGTNDISGISVRSVALKADESPSPDATVLDTQGQADNGVPNQTSASKLWSAALITPQRGIGSVRQTEPIRIAEISDAGQWKIPNVPLRQIHEVSFAKPGFDTQSYIVSPPDDGTAVELDVVLEPAVGAVSGRVVSGGSPLGGVEVELSDGSLTFTTTSATDGDDIGGFSFDSVSTPNVYTLSAERTGFGTTVLQVPLTAGEQRTDLEVTMQAGVASISGVIVSQSGPVGGAKVTATNGDITRSTNSLTDGARGTYNIPQLDIGSSYTLTVEFGGYRTETRRIPVNANVPGVDFTLQETTSQMTGSVRSAGGTDPISKDGILAGSAVNAGVTLNNGGLIQFKTTATLGEFSVGNVPPGTYTVTVDHFQHDPVTELIEVVPGFDARVEPIVMQVRDQAINVGTGNLEVVQTNATPKPGDDETVLYNATITLLNLETEEMLVESSGESTSTLFEDLRVGTWELTVKVDTFAKLERIISVRAGGSTEVVDLKGDASVTGLVVDAVTGESITDYDVNFSRVRDGTFIKINSATIEVRSDPSWGATAPVRALEPGRYLIEIVNANGYEKPFDQSLQTGLDYDPDPTPGANEAMQLDIGRNNGEPTVVPTIRVRRYPTISGRVFMPRLIGGPQAPTTGTQFTAIDSPVTAKMICGDRDRRMDASTEVGDIGFSLAKEDVKAAFFPENEVPESGNFGPLDCRIDITAVGFDPTTVSVPAVKVSNGQVLSDRVIAAAMHRPVGELNGSVFWVNPRGNREVRLPGVDISANVVTSFSSIDDSPLQTGSQPNSVITPISTVSESDGSWTFGSPSTAPQQVFGGARYTFKKPGFADGQIDVVINENRQRTITDVSGVILAELNGLVQVELTPPNDGRVFGTLDIKSIKAIADRNFGGAEIVVRDPSGTIDSTGVTPVTPVKDDPASPECNPQPVGGVTTPTGLCLERNGADMQVRNAAAGTWTFDFVKPPPNHVFAAGAPTSVEDRLEPESELGGFQTTFVELGSVEVELVSNTNVGINSNLVALSMPGGLSANATFAGGGAGPDNNRYRANGVTVNLANPTDPATALTHTLNVITPGYDRAQSQVFLDGVELIGVSSDAIPLTFRAGSSPKVRIVLESFGTVTTKALGIIADGELTRSDGVEVVLQKVDVNGVPDPAGTLLAGPTAPSVDGTISFSGPEGYYEFKVRHPNYELAATSSPTGGTCSQEPSPDRTELPIPATTQVACDNTAQIFLTGFPNGVFWLQNDSEHLLSAQFQLALLDSRIDLTVLESLASGGLPAGQPVADAQYQLDGGPLIDVGPSGVISIPVTPGQVVLRVIGASGDRFPVTVDFPVPRSVRTDADNDIVAVGFVTITAPLPKSTARISGDVIARSGSGQPVPIPQFNIQLSYDEPKIVVDGIEITNAGNNDFDEPNTPVPDPGLSPMNPGRGRAQFSFPNLVGSDNPSTHILNLPLRPGFLPPTIPLPPAAPPGVDPAYALNTTGELMVNGLGVLELRALPDITYTAITHNQVTVTFGVAGNIYPDVDVQLLRPNGGVAVSRDPIPSTDGPITVVFNDVEPHIDPYMLTITDALHTTAPQTVLIPLELDTTVPYAIPNVTQPTADLGRVGGSVGLFDGPPATSNSPLDTDSIVCLQTRAQTPVNIECKPGTANTAYFFDAPAGTNYQVQLRRPDPTNPLVTEYTIDTKNVNLSAGQFVSQNLQIDKLASITITLNPSAPPGATVTLLRNSVQEQSFPTVRDGATFNVFVPPGDYRVAVAGGTLNSFFWPGSTTTQPVVIGQQISWLIPIPRVVDVVGILRDTKGRVAPGAQVTMTGPGMSSVTVTTDTNNGGGSVRGRFIFPNVSNNVFDGSPAAYTFNADVPGFGQVQNNNTLVVTSTETTPANPGSFDLVLEPDLTPVTIDFTGAGGEPVVGSTITLEGFGPQNTQLTTTLGGDVGRVSYPNIPENEDQLSIVVTNSLYQSPTALPLTNAEINAGSAARVLQPKTADVTFTARGSTGAGPLLGGVTVVVTSTGNPSNTLSDTTSSNTVDFGTVTITIPATFGPSTWTAGPAGDDYDQTTGGLNVANFADSSTTQPAVLPFIPVEVDIVQGAASATTYTVQYCVAPAAAAPCGAGATPVPAGATSLEFMLSVLPADAPSYQIEALDGAMQAGFSTFSVAQGMYNGARPIQITVP